MPIVRIELAKGESVDFLGNLMDSIHEVLIEVLGIPGNDRNQRLIEYDPRFFKSKEPYRYFIEISLFHGRSKEVKSKLFKRIVNTLHRDLKISPESVFIILNEQPKENWGIRGGIAASEVEFDFKIHI